jgi:hexosaminidase
LRTGHAASWCKGYPEICPSTTCLQPLDPSSNVTFPLITSLLSECTGADVSAQLAKPYVPKKAAAKADGKVSAAKQNHVRGLAKVQAPAQESLFPYSLLHLGGDEVSYTCWEQDPEIVQWEADNGINGSEGTYEYFVDRVATIARDQARTPVQWVEVFEHFGR